MAKCKFKIEFPLVAAFWWECPLEAESGKDYCYWHKEEDGKKPDMNQLKVLKKRKIKEVYLKGANLVGAHLEGAYLEGADLKGALLVGAHLEGANLVGAHLKGAHLEGADLEGAFLVGAHLKGAYLEGADLEGAYPVGAHLEGAYLRKAHLEGANLSEAHLEGADLSEAHLEGANLSEAHLEGADLSEAHLEGAELSEAHLEGANLRLAHLEGAYFGEVRVDGKTYFDFSYLNYSNLSFSYIDGTKTLRNAEFDSKSEINEIVADLLRKKGYKIVVLDAVRIRKDHPDLYRLLIKIGILKYTAGRRGFSFNEKAENEVFFFNKKKKYFVSHPGGECVKAEKAKEIAENLDKYLLQNPPEGDKENPKKYKKELLINLYEASYDVFNMLYYFYIQNGKLDEALEMHRRRSDVRRKILMVKGGWTRVRAIFYDLVILKFLTGYGLNVLRPIFLSFLTVIIFALLFWATGGISKLVNGISYKPDFWDYLYHSVITFTSLGYSNIVPNLEIGHLAQGLVAAESILGAFLIALIIFTITYRVSK